jgi:hypothetical protein
MIFVNNDITVGSKVFTHELANAIRPMLAQRISADELDDFDLCLLQNMVNFADLSANDFNFVLNIIEHEQGINDMGQKGLIQSMQADPRYQADPITK